MITIISKKYTKKQSLTLYIPINEKTQLKNKSKISKTPKYGNIINCSWIKK